MIFLELLLGLAILIGSFMFVMWAAVKVITYQDNRKEIRARKQFMLNQSKPDPWEEEFVRSLRSAHHVVKIEPQKYVFRFGKPDGPQIDGWQWTCYCGTKDGTSNLEGAERLYKKHLTAEAEKAAAALGKFKLPAGIDWSMNVD